MPLKENFPRIDDRNYDEIIRELKTRIARYTPEWTDVNESDPGYTLAQVFAWLSDMLIYRMQQVPRLNYLKFLEMLGIELRPAEPAVTEIYFPVTKDHPGLTVDVPSGTQVAAEKDDGTGIIIFETEQLLTAFAARISSVKVKPNGHAYTDVTELNTSATQGFHPFGEKAVEGSCVLIGFSAERDFPSREVLNLAVWIFDELTGRQMTACGLPSAAVYPSSAVVWEYLGAGEWTEITLLKDETLAMSRSGHVHLRTPGDGMMQKAKIDGDDTDYYWIRCRLEKNRYENTPKLLAIQNNTIEAKQAETIVEETLGGSNGGPNQTFALENTPVLKDTLVLEVDEGEGYRQWKRVDDFFGSSQKSTHYVLNRTTGEIRFGDGKNGAIPIANVTNRDNIKAKIYCSGGGLSGNLPARKITALQSSIEGIDESGVMNLFDAHSGRDEETVEEARARAPREIKSRDKAVTSDDYEDMAKQAANIRRAKALPLHHPQFPGTKVPGVMSVIVVPESKSKNPIPSEGTLKTVCSYLNERRLLTTELYVLRPTYRKIRIEGNVVAHDSADIAEVKKQIHTVLLDYLHPLKGGEDGKGWGFGDDVYYSLVYQRVFTVPGVKRIKGLSVVMDGEKYDECKDVPIEEGTLVYSTEHDVKVNYDYSQ